MVSKALGSEKHSQVLPLEMQSDLESAYATYAQGKLARIIMLNMKAVRAEETDWSKPQKYSFPLSRKIREAKIERLEGPGSDASKNITFRGFSYDYEADLGKPVAMSGVEKTEERILVKDGKLELEVPASSAVLLTFH